MKKLLLSLLIVATGLIANGQQSQLSKNNEAAGDKAFKEGMICAAGNAYQMAYSQYKSNALMLKYIQATYQCGDFKEVIDAVKTDCKIAEALRFKALAKFKYALKYNGAEEDKCIDAYHEALVILDRAKELGLNVDDDISQMKLKLEEQFKSPN